MPGMALPTPSPVDRGHPTAERRVVDLLPDSFALDRSESEWLVTLLDADELRYIFEGRADDEDEG